MGRPFGNELAELEETHRWACNASIDSLADVILKMRQRPLLAVGSGGSFSTAAVASTLYRDFGSNLGLALTPQGLALQRAALRHSSVLVATASGSNPDAIGVLKSAALNDAALVLAICTKVGSKLAGEASGFSNVVVEEFPIPSEGDGFLATNSLWTSVVLLTRAFCKVSGSTIRIPKRLARVVGASRWRSFVKSVEESTAPIWERDTTIVLYGPTSYPAAVDLESKLTEAALTNVWIADYRHFAHGRHHWIAKHREQTSVVAFIEDDESELASRTINELPNDVPVVKVPVTSDPLGMLCGLAHVFPMASSAGRAAGIDPGRPGVPSFGRRIYRLNAYGKLAPKHVAKPDLESAAIERKAGATIESLARRGNLDEWNSAYRRFVDRLRAARFSVVVFDYDGTLCDPSERRFGLRSEVANELVRLLDSGVVIGIATGRGKSVREALCDCISKQHWKNVTVGYYNGGDIALLDNSNAPDGTKQVGEELSGVWSTLKRNKRLERIAKVEGRRRQITVETKDPRDVEECWQIVMHAAAVTNSGRPKAVRSSHSFDVLPAEVSKLDVLSTLIEDGAGEILAIGDMGRWPGNDCELLSHEHALSVDEVSVDSSTCWNLASPGIRGVEATLEYLSKLHVDKRGNARLKLPARSKGARP